MTTTLNTQAIATRYNVTEDQMDLCNRIIDGATGKPFYQVESQTTADVIYTVRYNVQFHKLSCNCKAGAEGLNCWHKRAAMACETEYKLLKQAEHQAEVRQAASQMTLQEVQEQSQIEAYVRQGIDRATAMRVVYAQGPRYNEQDICQAQYLNQPNAFSLMR